MGAKNAILLIVKQFPGIKYSSLLAKTAGDYSNINSARAALSRTLKDLKVYGYVQGLNNGFFITPKAELEISAELKNKLVMKLNSLVNAKNSEQEIDAIVEHLHTLIERSKSDKDLLKAAKGSTEFFITDLSRLRGNVDRQAKHFSYISGILEAQISSMEELGFKDSMEMDSSEAGDELARAASKLNLHDFVVEVNKEEALNALGRKFEGKVKGNSFSKKIASLAAVIREAARRCAGDSSLIVTLYLGALSARLHNNIVYVVGPYTMLEKIFR